MSRLPGDVAITRLLWFHCSRCHATLGLARMPMNQEHYRGVVTPADLGTQEVLVDFARQLGASAYVILEGEPERSFRIFPEPKVELGGDVSDDTMRSHVCGRATPGAN